MPYSQRIDQVMKWLEMDEDKRPSLINVYIDKPDSQEHKTGPDSEQVSN